MTNLFARIENGVITNPNFHRGMNYDGVHYGLGVSDEFFTTRGWVPIIDTPVPADAYSEDYLVDTKLVISDDQSSVIKMFRLTEKFDPRKYTASDEKETIVNNAILRTYTLTPLITETEMLDLDKQEFIDNHKHGGTEMFYKENETEYSLFEMLTWMFQSEEVREYVKDNTVSTPFIDALAEGRGVTKEEMINRILVNIDLYKKDIGLKLGNYQKVRDELKNASNTTELDTIFTTNFPDKKKPRRY